MNTPPFPEAFASAIGLGSPKQYYPVKKMRRIGNLVAFFVFMAGSVLVFLYGIYQAYLAYQQHGPATIDDTLFVPSIIALVLFLIGLAAGWAAYANWNRGALVYEGGFAVRNRKGVLIWRWDEIASLTAAVTRHYTNGIYTGTTHVYTLINRRNERLILNDAYAKVEDLARMVQDSIFPNLYEQAAQQYNAGNRLVFGPVTVAKDGIQIGKRIYPWAEVQQVSIQQGVLKVSKRGGGWFSGASAVASTIPNLWVLLNIIHQVVGLKGG